MFVETAEELAGALWERARADEQAVRVVEDEDVAAEVRARVRRLASEEGVRIRTARMGDKVAVVRLDAAIWRQDAATMRAKLGMHEKS